MNHCRSWGCRDVRQRVHSWRTLIGGRGATASPSRRMSLFLEAADPQLREPASGEAFAWAFAEDDFQA
jgi:hypothetical protein